MNIKRILIMVMCSLMAISFTSCLQSNDNITPTTTSPTTTQPTIETPTQISTPEKIGNMTFGTAFYKAQIGASIMKSLLLSACKVLLRASKVRRFTCLKTKTITSGCRVFVTSTVLL